MPICSRLRSFKYIVYGAAFTAAAVTGCLWAATPASKPTPTSKPSDDLPSLAVPKRIATTQPRIDASIDDPAWTDAAVIPSLGLCVGPSAKSLTATPTEVRVLWDDQSLFVRFIATDDDLYAPNGTDKTVLHSGGDVAEIFLDPVGDGRQFFEIQCNPVGGWVDGLHVLTTQPASGPDGVLLASVMGRDAWFALNWEVRGMRVAGAAFQTDARRGWVADFALPAKPILHRLGLAKFGPMQMRVNFVRYNATHPNPKDPRPTVEMAWSPVVWGRPHRSPARMGFLMLTQ